MSLTVFDDVYLLYRSKDRLVSFYLIFLFFISIIITIVLLLPYSNKRQIVGITQMHDDKLVIVCQINSKFFLSLDKKEVVINRKKQKYKVIEVDWINEDVVKVILQTKLKKHLQKETLPILLEFDFGKTTLLEQVKEKMKGWFL